MASNRQVMPTHEPVVHWLEARQNERKALPHHFAAPGVTHQPLPHPPATTHVTLLATPFQELATGLSTLSPSPQLQWPLNLSLVAAVCKRALLPHQEEPPLPSKLPKFFLLRALSSPLSVVRSQTFVPCLSTSSTHSFQKLRKAEKRTLSHPPSTTTTSHQHRVVIIIKRGSPSCFALQDDDISCILTREECCAAKA